MLEVSERIEDEIDDATEALDYDFLSDSEEFCVINTAVPYNHTLKRTISYKSNILVNGFVIPNAQRFTIDLNRHVQDKFKNKKWKDVVLHINPRFDQNCVVRNTLINGEWGSEEVQGLKRNPFKRGQMFIMEIYVIKTEFLISVNGVHFCSFSHRVNPLTIDSIYINGDVQLLKVELSVREMYPSTESALLLEDDPHNKMGTPFNYRLPPSGLRIGSKIEIKGRVKLLPQEFQIRLQSGPEVYPHPAIPYQLSAIWRPEKKRVSVNAWTRVNGHWGPEIICPNAFKPYGQFLLIIFIEKYGFRTDLAHYKFPLLEHTIELASINTVHVSGDIVINDIKTMNPENKTMYHEKSKL